MVWSPIHCNKDLDVTKIRTCETHRSIGVHVIEDIEGHPGNAYSVGRDTVDPNCTMFGEHYCRPLIERWIRQFVFCIWNRPNFPQVSGKICIGNWWYFFGNLYGILRFSRKQPLFLFHVFCQKVTFWNSGSLGSCRYWRFILIPPWLCQDKKHIPNITFAGFCRSKILNYTQTSERNGKRKDCVQKPIYINIFYILYIYIYISQYIYISYWYVCFIPI